MHRSGHRTATSPCQHVPRLRSATPGHAWLVALALGPFAAVPSIVLAQPDDEPTEFPYERCLEAEAIGPISTPYAIEAELEAGDESTQVDFYSFSAEPGRRLVAELRGQSSGAGSLPDPLLGLFDADCDRLADNDDWYSLDSRLEFVVPSDGTFLLAAAAYPDTEFDGSGNAFGSYRLSVDQRQPPIGSISARVVDARSRQALRGDASPGARVLLIACTEDLFCERSLVALNANSEGRVTFDEASFGGELLAGNYTLVAEADDYGSARVGPFAVAPGQRYEIGDIALEPPPISVLASRPCSTLPPLESVCSYEVVVVNNTDVVLRGMAWSIVEGWGIGAGLDRTLFEASAGEAPGGGGRRATLRIDSGAHATLRFAFRVPSFVAARASFCTSLFVGLSPDPLINTTKEQALFCVEKSSASFRLLSEHEARKLAPDRDKLLVKTGAVAALRR